MWPEPWLALNPAFEPGGSVGELVDRGLLHPDNRGIFRARATSSADGQEIAFHQHQVDAIEIAARRESYVLTTGTGSGKSMAYIVPIVDRVLREGSGRGVRAIIVYPMNALANSQRGELEKFLGKVAPKVTFKRYTGQESRAERDVILARPPDILLTNYVMLELMLTRPRERTSLITSARNLSFLVLDELHTYRGRQGADVAMLIRRLRGAVGAQHLQCVGTSATLAGPGTRAAQRAEVATLASRLFGTSIPAANIVGESLRRATVGESSSHRLTARVLASPPADQDALRRDDLAIWIEQTFGLGTDDEGSLSRLPPVRLQDAAGRLAELTGTDLATCARALRELCWPARSPATKTDALCSPSNFTSSSARATPPTSPSTVPNSDISRRTISAVLLRDRRGSRCSHSPSAANAVRISFLSPEKRVASGLNLVCSAAALSSRTTLRDCS
ncbi:Helicase [Amycolatopsis camponoti]|uniref:Helicase n=2 Tax=Amycolatopsis camponoti TaxID=2606593 RepID=A0A6I8LX02_9PSEU|nr:Helicase [Amycolatopsis camponoti]